MNDEKDKNKHKDLKSNSLIEHRENLFTKLTIFLNKLLPKTNEKACKTKESEENNGYIENNKNSTDRDIKDIIEKEPKEVQKPDSDFLNIDLIHDIFKNKESNPQNNCSKNTEKFLQEPKYNKEMNKKIDYFKANLNELKKLSSEELIELNKAYWLRIRKLENDNNLKHKFN